MSFYVDDANHREALTADAPDKQRLSDTYLSFLPKNTSGYTYKNQIVDIQIPKSEHVINLARAYMILDLHMVMQSNANYAAPASGAQYVGIMNAATIFDQVQIKNNGKTIWSDTFSQVNSRLWQMAKSSKYLASHGASFLNIDDITMNEGFLVHKITTAWTKDLNVDLTFKLKIPMPAIYQAFDNVDAFSTTQLNDDVTLSLQLSTPDKYLVLITTDDNGKVTKVEPFNGNTKSVNWADEYDPDDCTHTEHKIIYKDDETYTTNTGKTLPCYMIDYGLKMIAPGHYPTDEESMQYNSIVANGGWFRPFRSFSIQSQQAQFGPSTAGMNQNTALNYNTNVANLYGVLMLCSHNQSYTVYDKPYIDKIECNVSEMWKLANEKVHSNPTYTNDQDMYQDILNAFGVPSFPNLERFDKAISIDYRNKKTTVAEVYDTEIIVKRKKKSDGSETVTSDTHKVTDSDCSAAGTYADDPTDPTNYQVKTDIVSTLLTDATKYSCFDDNMLGSYMQYYKMAPGNQVGFPADYFNNQINYKFENLYKEITVDGLTSGTHIIKRTPNNYDNSSVFCCCHTLSFLVYKEGGIDIINPFSSEIDVRAMFNGTYNSIAGNGHGLGTVIASLFKPVTDLIGKGASGLRGLVKENRDHNNKTYAYSQLGKDGYENHREIIESNSTMPKRKFKKFINGLKQTSHGLIVAHGEVPIPGGSSGSNFEKPEAAEFDDFNLRPFIQSYSADLADCEYKNQLILDYKYRFNTVKLRLGGWGNEAAMEANNYHGFRDWVKRGWGKLKGWFKKDGKKILKDLGGNLLGVAKEYATKIATGEMKLSDLKGLKPELKEKVMELVQNSTKGTALEGVTGDALKWYNKYKKGELQLSEIPKDLVARVKELALKEKASGGDHGLIVRHGFVPGPRIKPSQIYSVQKRRIERLKGKNPMELNRNQVRKLVRFNYLKENGVVDPTHGRLTDLLMKRYGQQVIKPAVRPVEPVAKPALVGGQDGVFWKNRYIAKKRKYLGTEHGIAFWNKWKKIKRMNPAWAGINAPWEQVTEGLKRFRKDWKARQREKEAAQQSAPAAAEAPHGIAKEEYLKNKQIWKAYKKKFKSGK